MNTVNMASAVVVSNAVGGGANVEVVLLAGCALFVLVAIWNWIK